MRGCPIKIFIIRHCDSNGVNAFFVRRDKKPQEIRELTCAEGYVSGQYGEKFEVDGDFIKLPPEEEKRLLNNFDLPLVNLDSRDFRQVND